MRNAVTIVIGREPGWRGHWLPAWRLCVPGYGFAEDRVGDSYCQFLALWRGVAWAIKRWDLDGRPEPAWQL